MIKVGFFLSQLQSNDSSNNQTSYDYDEDELIWNSESAANLSSSQDPPVFLEEMDEKTMPKIRPNIKPDRAGGKEKLF